jgi:DNA-binding NarL/FixJ family response regulator
MNGQRIRVLCVDDHAFLVDGLKARFAVENDIECVGRLASAEQLMHEVKALKPDVVLMDIEMPGPDAFEAASTLRHMHPGVRVVFLSAHIRDHYIGCAMQSGANGYFSKGDEPASIVEGIRRVLRKDDFVFSPKVEARMKPASTVRINGSVRVKTALETLSPREREVLRLIGRGMTRSQIAESLCRSPKTVDGHREKIMEKLDVHDRGELVRYAIREGLAEI